MITIVKMVFGSHLYGLDHADSDTDYKGVVLPTSSQILRQEADFHISKSTGADNAKNGADDVDEEYFSLMRFIKLAMKGETVALDMLHAPEDKILESNYFWDNLVDNRHRFYTKNMKAYIGYVRRQAAKYSVKGERLEVIEEVLKMAKYLDNGMGVRTINDFIGSWPINEYARVVTTNRPSVGVQTFYEIAGRKFQSTLKLGIFSTQLQVIYDNYGARARTAKDNKGKDWKAISHALRAGYQAYHIYKDGGFEYPLPETDFLMKVKMGELDYLTEVAPELDRIVAEVEALAEASDYPDTVDHKFWLNWLEDIHSNIVRADSR